LDFISLKNSKSRRSRQAWSNLGLGQEIRGDGPRLHWRRPSGVRIPPPSPF